MSKDAKISNGESLRQVERQTGKRPKALDGPPLPVAARHLWSWFVELNAGRSWIGFRPAALSYTEIDAWVRLKGLTLAGVGVGGDPGAGRAVSAESVGAVSKR